MDCSSITVENSTGKHKVKADTVQVKEGDYVLVEGGAVVEKITKREAEQIERSLPCK